jgi:hypothetical protein
MLDNFYFPLSFKFEFDLGVEVQYDANDDYALLNMLTCHYQK